MRRYTLGGNLSLKNRIKQYVTNSCSGEEKVIFLDLCHWYRLLDEPNYSNLKATLEKGVENNDILCPVSYSILCEFRKNQDKELVLKRIDFADKLSKRLSFLHHNRIQKMEFFRFGSHKMLLSQKDVLTHWLDSYPVPFRLEQNGASDIIYDNLITSMINISPVEWSKYNELWNITDGITEYFFKPQAKIINDYNNEISRSKIQEEELKRIVLELLDTLSQDLTVLVSEIEAIAKAHYLNIENYDSMKTFFKNTPTINIRSQIHTSLRLDKHAVKPNDLWDFEHATSLPYTDIYVTDKPSAHILKNVLKLDKKYGVEILSSLEELSQILRV